MELDLSGSPPSAETTLAARRAKRRAILAKYAGIASISVSQTASPSPGPTSAVEPPIAFSSVSNPVSHINSTDGTPGVSEAPTEGKISKRESESVSPTPASFSLAKDGDEEDVQAKAQAQNGVHEQISAADYDPSLDRREDEQKRVRVKEEPTANVEDVEEIEVEEDEIDDMFAAVTSEKNVKKVKKIRTSAPALITTTLDSAADPEGYYQIILGEQLDGGRYQVYSSLGKGMFANVVRARVIHGEIGDAGKEVAIKIVRCQESMYRAGLKEVQILNKLKQADPEDRKHIVRLERTFEHRGHLCLVFESLSMNLRDVVKRFGKDVGLNIKAVRAYAHQLFLAMSLLRKCNIMHADIKPDNILVNEHKTLLKLCDLGSASDASENEITPYLVSRFYRAPEIILGVPYDPALDIWSIGCTLYELYTGKILFPGRSNNQMLLLMMELKGRFNTKMIKKAKFGEMYFDELGGFGNIEQDRVTGSNVVRKVHITTPTRDLRQRLMPPTSVKLKDDEAKLLSSFVDLLDKCLALDPARRITPKEALLHPFIRG
ncbi:kinase-like protein [Sparassis latifolia]